MLFLIKNLIDMNLRILLSLLFLSISFSFNDKKIEMVSKNNSTAVLKYSSESFNINEFDDKKSLVENYYTNLEDQSLYPSQSVFYQIKDGYDILVDFSVNSSHVENNIFVDDKMKSQTKNSFFPKNNLIISEDMIFRGVVIKQITFYPYSLNMLTGEIEIYDDVDLNITEVEVNETRNYSKQKLSKSFEPLYEDLIVNYESSSRDEDYQTPAVLYICGGSSLNNSYVQELLICTMHFPAICNV